MTMMRRPEASIAVILVLIIAWFATVSAQSTKYEENENDHDQIEREYLNPIKTADLDEVKSLPGLNDPINFRQFSGYLSADNEAAKSPSKFLHYWFVESQNDPTKDPILLWLNGGPGCSSLGGMFTELGPFSVNEDGKTLRLNEFSWNKAANVLFLESPAGVGFSYSSSLINIHTDDATAHENYHALKAFMRKFPQYKNSSLYLSGESYAGVYLPTLGVLADADPELNLKGIAIGNGYLDAGKLADSLVFFAYHHGLIGKSTWDRVTQHCCNNKPPSRENCVLSGPGSSWSCGFAVAEVTAVLSFSGLNPYNLYGKCLSAKKMDAKLAAGETKLHSTRELVDRTLMQLTLNGSLRNDDRPFHVHDPRQTNLGIEPPCFDDHTLINYLNQPEVRSAIHIPKKVQSWDTCSLIVYVVKYPKLPGGLAPQMKQLIKSKRNLSLLVYNGDVDTVCNFLGDEWFVDDLGQRVVSDYKIWRVNNQVAGFMKHYEGIVFVTVRGSGHMVPSDKPQEAFEMIKIFLNATNPKLF